MKPVTYWVLLALIAALGAGTLWFVYGGNFDAPLFWAGQVRDLTGPYKIVFCAPIFSFVVFGFIHWADNRPVDGAVIVKGYKWSLRKKQDEAEYLDSAITRQGIQSAIGIGVAAALTTIGELWRAWSGDRFIMASMAVGTLALATLLSMMSVLCYSHAKRWPGASTDPDVARTRGDLVSKAKNFDELSWYVLVAGLLWAVAIASVALSIWANIAYFFCLYFYYFSWNEDPPRS